MIRRDDVYKIGKLGKPHGVKGEITFAITDDVFDRVDADYLILDIDGILVLYFIVLFSPLTTPPILIFYKQGVSKGWFLNPWSLFILSFADIVPTHLQL